MSSGSPNEDDWRRLAEAGLEGSTIDKLVTKTPEGIAVEPLYVPRHLAGLAARGEPGAAPFVRGGGRPGPSWVVAERLDVRATRATSRAASASRAGAGALWLVGAEGTPPASWEAVGHAAAGQDLHVLCDAGVSALSAEEALSRGGARRVSALYDPIGAAFVAGPPTGGLEARFGEAARAVERTSSADVRPLAVGASAVHEAGGHAALELGFVLASLAELVRRLAPHGISAERVLASAALSVTAGVDQFAAIAKLRALRLAYAKLAHALGVAVSKPPLVVGHVSRRGQSRADSATNHVRATIEVFALAVGGADVIVGRAFDDLAVEPTALGERMARNTALVLREESRLGEVADAAGGSYFIERQTEDLARAGWEELRAIEREGGITQSLASGVFGGRVRQAAAALLSETRRRKRVIVGTSEYAVPGERLAAARPAPRAADDHARPVRVAEPFEAVRERAEALEQGGARPVAVTVRLGAPPDWRARDEFARRLFEVGGFEVRAASLDDAKSIARDAGASARTAFVLCSSDARYAELGADSTRELALAGARAVVLAGKPGALEGALRAAGLFAEIYLGCDVPGVLEMVLQRLGSKEVAS
ncbi:MAG: hypothetical protein JNL21_15420 [Myxococcales bacterium]|nr:hypothetical protein [Myxococcales bacterium]